VVAQAADKTASAGGAKMAFVIQVQGQTLHGAGFVDPKGRRARLTFQLPKGQGAMETVYVGQTIYMQFPPALRSQVPGGKSWVKIDLRQFGQKQGIDIGALQSTSGNDPSAQLEQLRGAGDVKKAGTEQVRGTPTTHYTATLDLRRAADRAPAAQRDAARRSIDRIIKLTGQSTLPTEVWLDAQGRARRMKVSQSIRGQSFTYTMDLYDFGTREALKAPPASETADLTQLAAKRAAGP
jgi:hypothetical protein